jgi:hypothetical protein
VCALALSSGSSVSHDPATSPTERNFTRRLVRAGCVAEHSSTNGVQVRLIRPLSASRVWATKAGKRCQERCQASRAARHVSNKQRLTWSRSSVISCRHTAHELQQWGLDNCIVHVRLSRVSFDRAEVSQSYGQGRWLAARIVRASGLATQVGRAAVEAGRWSSRAGGIHAGPCRGPRELRVYLRASTKLGVASFPAGRAGLGCGGGPVRTGSDDEQVAGTGVFNRVKTGAISQHPDGKILCSETRVHCS